MGDDCRLTWYKNLALTSEATHAQMSLFPASKPHKEEFLDVSDRHSLYVAQYGKPDGTPVVFLHGGPGGGTDDKDACSFDPAVYRIVLFDQRGAGKSKPQSELEDNTTWHLVEDIEKIRKHLQIPKWHVFGGSWGSTLSLAYAQSHPKAVVSLTLRGIFTLRRSELEFFYQGPGTNNYFPEFWDDYISVIPEEERNDVIAAFYKRLTGPQPERRKAAAAWSKWEMATSRLHVNDEMVAKADDGDWADKFARIEAHYFVNAGWMRDGQLLEKAEVDKIRHIPCTIVQGRYDSVCPATTAWELHKVWPEADFIMVPDAGHNAKETGIQKALLEATNKYAKIEI